MIKTRNKGERSKKEKKEQTKEEKMYLNVGRLIQDSLFSIYITTTFNPKSY